MCNKIAMSPLLAIFAGRHVVMLAEQPAEGGIAQNACLVGDGIDVPVGFVFEQLAGIS